MVFESNLSTFQKLQKLPCFAPSEEHPQAGVPTADFESPKSGSLPAFSALLAGFGGLACRWLGLLHVDIFRAFSAFIANFTNLLDDWLCRERLVYVPQPVSTPAISTPQTAPECTRDGFNAPTVGTARYTHALASSFLEGCTS